MDSQPILLSKDKKRKFRVRVVNGAREILYVGDTFWQTCEEGQE